MIHLVVKTQCTSCGYEKEYTFEDFAGPEKEACPICSGRLKVLNLKEIKEARIIEGMKDTIQELFRKNGIEGTIELLECEQDMETKRLGIKAMHEHFPQLKVRNE